MLKINNKKRFVTHSADILDSNENFETLLKNVTTSQIKEGTVVKGQVVGVEKEVIIVDVGLKNEGRIAVEEFALGKNKIIPQNGDIIDVYVEKIEGRNGRTVLSREKAVREESWVHLEEACHKGELVQGFVFGRVKGGYTVDIDGVIAFLPRSQSEIDHSTDMFKLRDELQQFKISNMDKKLGNIVVSRKAISDASKSEEREKLLSTIKEGTIMDGMVKNITDYGAFIDLGSVDGLLHVTDISWSRVNHPSEVLAIGQKLKVMVIKFDEASKKISLGMKQLDDSMWQNIRSEFPIGKIMKGKVTNIKDYGVFIELKNGIEGLVHSSEISWLKSNQNPKKLLTIGQEIEFVVLEIDTEKHRISLSIKQCSDNPFIKFEKSYPVGSIIKAPVTNVSDFGIFVGIGNNNDIDGMIHESDISWTDNGHELLKNFKKGDEIECKVLSIDVEKERVALGIKQLKENEVQASLEKFSKGDHCTCVVKAIEKDGIEVAIIGTDMNCFIKKLDLSSDKADQNPERFSVGDKVDAKITVIDKKTSKITLSIKAFEVEERERVIKEYGSTDNGASLGDILGAALEEHKLEKKKK